MLPTVSDRPLRWVFLDLNSYFAAVEQAENPELLGKPIAVAPTRGEGATVIAASHEAKQFGVKTGTKVGDAKRMCPGLVLTPGRPPLYVHYHDRILSAVDTVLPVDKVCSIDEMRFRLLGDEMEPERALDIAKRLKKAILTLVAPNLTCSVGIAPNPFLAKLATEFQKPDGLVMIRAEELPERLFGVKLTEFPGINKRMEARLMAAGVFKSDDLYRLSERELVRAFGNKTGGRWYHLLRGYEVDFEARTGQSLGHSNVLAPEYRNAAGCHEILLRLVSKATARLRANDLWATHVVFHVQGRETSWQSGQRIPPCQDALTINEVLAQVWDPAQFSNPLQVGVTFTGLRPPSEVTPSLFDETAHRAHLGHAIDSVNNRFGKNSVFLASLDSSKDQASEKIAFNKTWLFSEGLGDNEWDGSPNPPKRKKRPPQKGRPELPGSGS